MNFQDALRFKMPFGKYTSKMLDEIGATDDGLLYLDWLRGERGAKTWPEDIDRALAAYLDEPTIAKDLAALVPKETT